MNTTAAISNVMSHNKKQIVLIDDDHGPMEYFVDALRLEGFEVEQIDETDTALERIHNWPKDSAPAMFIIDMMMPYGEHLSAVETDDGLRTGCFIVEACRKHLPNTPTVCLTNINGIEELRTRLGNVKHFAKFEISPFDFADEIKKILNNSSH